MEQRSPSAWPLACPTCGSRMIVATGVTARGQLRFVTRCKACRATWEQVAPGREDTLRPIDHVAQELSGTPESLGMTDGTRH